MPRRDVKATAKNRAGGDRLENLEAWMAKDWRRTHYADLREKYPDVEDVETEEDYL